MKIPEIPNYTEWLASLKVGDTVAVEMFSEKEETDYDVITIDMIDGKYIIGNRFQRFKNGIINIFVGHYTRICPVTQKVIDCADRKRLLRNLYDFNAKKYPTDKLRRFWAIIQEK